MPLRGGIASGPLAVRNYNGQMNLFGKALTNAYQIESIQQWSGCAIDDQCISILEEEPEVINELIESKVIVKYLFPNKSGPVKESYVINWCNHNELSGYNKGVLRTVFEMNGKKTDNWDTRIKFDNTFSFFKKFQK
ncbi:hypothetical protein AB4Z21_16305 [Paenibacillus sp. MCAF20]